MRRFLLTASIVSLPIIALAQSAPPPTPPAAQGRGKIPVIPPATPEIPVSGSTGSGTRSAPASTSAKLGDTTSNPTVQASIQWHNIRGLCTLVENEGKLFAACDNSTLAARTKGYTYLPQVSTEWEAFVRQLMQVDRVVNGKPRAAVVLNKGDVVAEASVGGVVKLKK